MAQEQAISIPLLSVNQKAPSSAGPVGRLQQIKNGVVNKIQDGQLRVQKRDGFAKLSRATRNPADGSQISPTAGVPAPALLSSADAAQRLVAGDNAGGFWRYNAELPAWVRANLHGPDTSITTNPDVYLPVSLQTNSLINNNAFVSMPDVATVGNLRCYVWGQGNLTTLIPAVGLWLMVIDSAGVVVRGPTQFTTATGSNCARVKVLSDGSNFWIFSDIGTTALQVFVVSGVDAQTLATNTTFDTMNNVGNHWDIVYDSSVGVCIGVPLAPTYGFRFTRLTYASNVISVADQHDNFDNGPSEQSAGTPVDCGFCWFTSREADGHVYAGMVANNGALDIFGAQINPNGTTAHSYVIHSDARSTQGVAALAGYVIPGTADIIGAWTKYPTTSTAPFNTVRVESSKCTFAGSNSPDITIQRGSALASRAVFIGGRFQFVIWYPSQLSQISDPNAPSAKFGTQPTYFLYDTESATIQPNSRLTGSFATQTAVMDWSLYGYVMNASDAPALGWFMLASPAQDANGIHVPLVTLYQRYASTFNFVAFTFTGNPGTALASVMITDVVFAGLPCRAVEYADELLLPGLAGIDEGDLTEQGFWLAPEPPLGAGQATAGGTHLTLLQSYQYIFVWEALDSRGDLVQSPISIAQTYTLTGSNNRFSLVLPQLHHTRRSRVLIGMYRTYINALGVMSTDHRQVFPLPISGSTDITQDTVTYIDDVPDATVAMGRPLYADPSATPEPLEYFAPPPFTVGDTFADREFVVGDDGKVYFSMVKIPGQAVAFHPQLSISLPSAERIRSVAAMDGFLIFGCDASIWFIENSQFPDAAGVGNIPTPQQLPFPNGMASLARGTKDGVFYVSTAGGIWMIGRDLTNVFVGGNIEDDAGHATIVDIVVDQAQRVHFLDIGGTQDLVWDPVVAQWYTHTLPGLPLLGADYNGQLVFADPTFIWDQIPGTFVDDTAAIITTCPLASMNFAGVPGLQMVWELQFLGSRAGRHTITITLFYDDGSQASEQFSADSDTLGINFALGQAYRFSVNPSNPECQAISATIVDSFPLGASAGYTLENIGASVGIVPGVRRIPLAQRIPG